MIARCALIVVLFVAGFFLASPFNFLDPTWGRDTGAMIAKSLGLGAKPAPRYDPDSAREFKPGAETSRGAAGAFLALVASRDALGIAFSLLALLGLARTFVRRETRWYGLLVLIPGLFFFLAAITVAAYHAQARHLNALYPLLATLAWPGALAVTASLPAAAAARPRRGPPAGGRGRRADAGRHGPQKYPDQSPGQPPGRLPLAAGEPPPGRAHPARRLRSAAQREPAGRRPARRRPARDAARPLHPAPGIADRSAPPLSAGGRLQPRRARPPVVAAAGEEQRRAARQRGRPRHGEPPDLPPAPTARGVPPRGGPLRRHQQLRAQPVLHRRRPRRALPLVRPLLPGARPDAAGPHLRSRELAGKGAGRLDLRPHPSRRRRGNSLYRRRWRLRARRTSWSRRTDFFSPADSSRRSPTPAHGPPRKWLQHRRCAKPYRPW